MKPEETIDFPLRWAWHSLTRFYNKEAQRNGISFTIGYALLNISPKKGILSSQLAPAIGMEPSSFTRTIKSMEEDGLVTKTPDPTDKRKVWLHLTSKGRTKRQIARDTVVQLNKRFQQRIGQQKLNNFYSTMNEINELLKTEIQSNESIY